MVKSHVSNLRGCLRSKEPNPFCLRLPRGLRGWTSLIYKVVLIASVLPVLGRPAGDRPWQLGHVAGTCNAGVWAGVGAGWDWRVHIGERGGFQLKVPHCPEWLQTVALVLSVLALIISFMR